jgi:hypothetical protein
VHCHSSTLLPAQPTSAHSCRSELEQSLPMQGAMQELQAADAAAVQGRVVHALDAAASGSSAGTPLGRNTSSPLDTVMIESGVQNWKQLHSTVMSTWCL